MLAGEHLEAMDPDDLAYVLDLGLVEETTDGLAIANPIYSEIVSSALAVVTRASFPRLIPAWLTPEGALAPDRLRDGFMDFWRLHGDALLASAPYPEVAPHLVLLAFLDRVANEGGTVQREYAIGRRRMDLCLELGAVRIGIEFKVWRARRAPGSSERGPRPARRVSLGAWGG